MRTIEFCHHLLERLNSNAIDNFQKQADARYLLYSVKEQNLPRFNTNLNESLGIVAYLYISLGFDFAHYQENDESERCFEKAGTILEHLHRDQEHQDEVSQYTLIVASLSYYCAGQISKAFVIAKFTDSEMPIGRMIKAFVTNQYGQLQRIVDEILLSDVERPVLVSNFARCFSLVLFFFQHGEFAKLEEGINFLHQVRLSASEHMDPGLWWVSRLLEHILQCIKDTSLWSHIPKLGTDEARIRKYIGNLFYSQHITQLFKTQIKAVDVIQKNHGAVISLPTSSGKTRIAELAILRVLMANPDSAVLYLAPFRSLAYEVETSFESVFPPLQYRVSHLYGNNDFSETDKRAMSESSIWIATPEKAKAIFRCGGFSKTISLVIMDEGHLISSNIRDLANEMFIEELRVRIQTEGGHFLVLSAVLPNVSDITRWLTDGDDNQLVSNWQISSQRMGAIVKYKNVADIEWDQTNTFFNRNFIKGVKDRKSTCAVAALQFRKAFGPILLFISQARYVPSYAKALYDVLPKDLEVDWRDRTCDWEKFVLKCSEEDPSGELLKYAKKGILCHNANLTSAIRISMERLLRKGKADYVVSSSTLAQGVNIGVSSVIFTSVQMRQGERVRKRDFWNIAGRAGRAFNDTEGRVLFYVEATDPSKVDYNRWLAWQYMGDKSVDAVDSGLLTILHEIIAIFEKYELSTEQMEWVLENDGFDQFELEDQAPFGKLDCIDDSLLSIVLEHDSSLERIAEYMDTMLALRQAEVANRNKYKRLLLARTRRNKSYVEKNKAYLAYTGMPLSASVYLFEHMGDVRDVLSTYKDSPQQMEDIIRLADSLEDVVLELPSNRITKTTKELLNKHRESWFAGVFISDNNERAAIENFYTLSVSWVLNAISSYYSNVEIDSSMTDIIMRINSCLRYGLPSYSACRVYAAGIESRQSSIELSPFVVNRENENLFVIRAILLHIKDKSMLSERTRAWLDILSREERISRDRTTYLQSYGIHVEDVEDEILHIGKKIENYYIHNADYSFVQEITLRGSDMMKAVSEGGVYFIKARDNYYELVSDNDRFKVVKQ